jgi:hypothetical protein
MLTIKKNEKFSIIPFLHTLLDSIRGKKEQKTKEKCVQFSNTRKFRLTEYNNKIL